ncbi:hypothetical protein [Pseudomonas oryzihabitans]|uniref:hypothetical protein n=1 Tax=Pseudomonas oryzihabitans TaxID=47885 RepID=UPI0015E33F1B|nr:hypothetical protein [Pseudomonas psychrotolerans]MBA1213925.1 hypothetical protein [Pseudomonas psychrotolerans]
MDVHKLRQEQRAQAGNYISTIYKACVDRYLDAAGLLEVDAPIIDKLHESRWETIDFMPLLDFYLRICERYNNELYSPQIEIFEHASSDVFQRWSYYFNHNLVPVLVADNRAVRDILRVMKKLPCSYPKEAIAALISEVDNMTLRSRFPVLL